MHNVTLLSCHTSIPLHTGANPTPSIITSSRQNIGGAVWIHQLFCLAVLYVRHRPGMGGILACFLSLCCLLKQKTIHRDLDLRYVCHWDKIMCKPISMQHLCTKFEQSWEFSVITGMMQHKNMKTIK